MSRIRIDPTGLRDAGLRYIRAADEATALAAQLDGLALPAMPAAMAARYVEALPAVAGRLRVVADAAGRLGEELQLRAAAAEAADAAGGDASLIAGQKLKEALAPPVTTAVLSARGGGVHTASIKVGARGVDVRSSTGLRLTIPELAVRPEAAAEKPKEHGRAAGRQDERPGDDPRPAPENRPAPAPFQPIGGFVAAGAHEAAATPAGELAPGAERYLQDDPIDPASLGDTDLRASEHDGAGGAPVPHEMPVREDADRQEWACWMAGEAARQGLPPALPLMMGLAHAGLRNMPSDPEGVGFFEIRAGDAYAPPGHGLPRNARPDADWWAQNPDAQLDHVIRRLGNAGGGIREAGLDDPGALGRWAQEAQPGLDASEYASAHEAAAQLVSRCRHGEVEMPGGGDSALAAARAELGTQELGVNAGPAVDRYLAAADTPSGNPWCASFVTWSLAQTGHEVDGGGWAAVSTWVNAAQAGEQGLQIVDASQARPGDIVAYDWGGDGDFGSDAHIGFLESEISEGRFTAIEGNAEDAVSRMERSLGMGNVVFIRAGG